jgi:hypothetical protein
MHGEAVVIGLCRDLRGAEKGFFDTKTLAMNRHLKIPNPNASVVDRGVLTPGSRAERKQMPEVPRTPTVNHERCAFTDYQR